MSFSQQIKTSKSDEYYTPRYAVEIILPYLEKFEHIWCPFDKENSEFVKMLQEREVKKIRKGAEFEWLNSLVMDYNEEQEERELEDE